MNTRIIDNLKEDVCSYVGIDESQFDEFCFQSTRNLVDQWNDANPQTTEDVTKYYKSNNLDYIGDLAGWHVRVEGRQEWFSRHLAFMDKMLLPPPSFLADFGCGIGTDALFLADNGYNMTCIELDNPAFDFAKWRAGLYDLPVTFMTPDDFLLSKKRYTGVFLIDVLEHIPDYEKVLRNVASRTLFMAISAPFADVNNVDDLHPQHLLSKKSISDIVGDRFHAMDGLYWVKTKYYLWAIGARKTVFEE